MVTKTREVQEGGSSDRLGVSAREPKRRPSANDRRTIFGGIPMDVIVSQLQPWLDTFFRGMVGEEVNRALSLSHDPPAMPSFNLSEKSGGCNLELRFVSEVSHTLYSGIPIETDGGTPLRITLVDRTTHETVTSGPLSLLKVELVVVSSEFGSDDEREDWTGEDFNRSVVREREGKRPLLMGEINMTLTGGVGIIGNAMFTDNSSWTRSKKFRLGVRVVSRTSTETRVREAISNPFSVKEHRGEKCKKHHPPFPHDEVWRLEQIRKDGPVHDHLRSHGIVTVIDFLRRYEVDPSALKNILGPGLCRRKWNAIVGHANTCVVDDGKFSTCYFASENVILLFNSAYRVLGAAFGGNNYLPLERLTSPQKALVESLKTEAHKKMSEWSPVDAPGDCTLNLLQLNEPSIDIPVVHQGQQGVVPVSNLLPASYNYEAVGYQQEELLQSQEIIRSFQFIDGGEASHVFQGAFGYDTRAEAKEYIFHGDEHCQWLPGSSCSTWDEGQPSLISGSGLNSNRSSLTSLNTLALTSTPSNADRKEERAPPPST